LHLSRNILEQNDVAFSFGSVASKLTEQILKDDDDDLPTNPIQNKPGMLAERNDDPQFFWHPDETADTKCKHYKVCIIQLPLFTHVITCN
jgi:hypothetical protein